MRTSGRRVKVSLQYIVPYPPCVRQRKPHSDNHFSGLDRQSLPVRACSDGKFVVSKAGEEPILCFEIMPQPTERLCTINLAGALNTDGGGFTLSVGREVKMEIPDQTTKV
jgi:hypothetical protein